jgi:hypothetical protein
VTKERYEQSAGVRRLTTDKHCFKTITAEQINETVKCKNVLLTS